MVPSLSTWLPILAVTLTGAAAFAQPPVNRPAPRMVVTIDDLPIAQSTRHTPQQMRGITEGLLAALTAHGVHAVGFVNAGKLEMEGKVDEPRVELLRMWLAAGQELGNHTRDHLSLHEVAVDEWLADVDAGEPLVKDLVTGAGGKWRWFRHPYLQAGTTSEIQAQTAAALAARGYTVAPVTIDNSEWVYGRAYAIAMIEGDEARMRRLGEDYLRYMLEVVAYYERQTELVVGRPIPQILLIHASALNGDWLDALLAQLEARGYGWTTLEAALADPVYARPIDGFTGKGGITWIHRWALTAGVDRKLLRGEPEVPRWVEKMANGDY